MSRHYPRRGGATAAALAAGKTLVLEDYDPQAFGTARTKHANEGARTVLVTPLPSRDGTSGVLHAGWREPFRPGPDDVRVLETLAAFGGSMIDNAQSQHKADQLASWLRAVIEHLPCGVVVADAKANLVLLNGVGRDILGGQNVSWLNEGISLGSFKTQRLMRQGGLTFKDTALAAALTGKTVREHEYLFPASSRTALAGLTFLHSKPRTGFTRSLQIGFAGQWQCRHPVCGRRRQPRTGWATGS